MNAKVRAEYVNRLLLTYSARTFALTYLLQFLSSHLISSLTIFPQRVLYQNLSHKYVIYTYHSMHISYRLGFNFFHPSIIQSHSFSTPTTPNSRKFFILYKYTKQHGHLKRMPFHYFTLLYITFQSV